MSRSSLVQESDTTDLQILYNPLSGSSSTTKTYLKSYPLNLYLINNVGDILGFLL